MRRRTVAALAIVFALLVISGSSLAVTGPSTPILDNFDRADNGGPPSASWSHQPTGSTGSSNDLKVASNRATGNAAGSNTDYWNPSTFGPDSEAYVTVAVKPSADLDTVALGLREQSPDTSSMNGYQAYYYNRSSTDQYEIAKRTNGSYTTLGTRVSGPELNAGDKLWFKAVGSTLELYRFNGTTWSLVLSRTDSTYGAGGYISLTARNSVVRLDDFGGGTISSGSPPTNTSLPTISGSPQQGQTLIATQGTWTGTPTPTLADQWRHCDTSGANCVDIVGATGLSYVLTASDVGFTLRVLETATNANGSASASSAATAVVTSGGGTGSGGSGLAAGLVRQSLTLPLHDNTETPTGLNGTTYFFTYRPATVGNGATDGPYDLLLLLPGSVGSNCLQGAIGGTIPIGYSAALADCEVISGGSGGTTNGQFELDGWKNAADTRGFLMAMPISAFKKEGAPNPRSNDWTGGYGAPGTCPASGECATSWFDAEALIRGAVDYVTQHANVKLSHIWLAGESAGANASIRIMCGSSSYTTNGQTYNSITPDATLRSMVSGYGLWSGGLPGIVNTASPPTVPPTSGTTQATCTPAALQAAQPTIFDIHGTSDTVQVPYNGNCGSGTNGNTCFLGQTNDKNFINSTLGCSQTSTNTVGKLTTTLFGTGCLGGRAYELQVVNMGGHANAMFKTSCGTPDTGNASCIENIPIVMYDYLSTHT